MKNSEFENLKNRLDEIEEQYENVIDIDENELEDKVYELERDINAYKEMSNYESGYISTDKLSKRIKQIKKENDFYDEDATLDMMFPDRHDPDFDEDSMSYDSAFGGD